MVLAGTMWRSQKAGRQNQGKVCVARLGEFQSSFTSLFLIVYLFHFSSSGAGKKNCCQAESTAPSSTQAEVSDDPYATLQAEQRKREMQWKSQRVAKRSKAEEPAVLQTAAIPSETRPSEVICTVIENVADQSDQTDELKTQLEAKSQECSNLKRQLEISEKKREADAEALRKQTQVNGDIMKVSV